MFHKVLQLDALRGPQKGCEKEDLIHLGRLSDMWGPPSRGALLICILVSGPGLSPSAQSLVSCLSFSQLPPATPLPAQPEVCAPSEALMQSPVWSPGCGQGVSEMPRTSRAESGIRGLALRGRHLQGPYEDTRTGTSLVVQWLRL